MALFKIFKGSESDLNNVSIHEGYAYFCSDTGNMFIDTSSADGSRIQVNAYAAKELVKYNSDGTIASEIDIDDLLLASMIANVTQGGTGTNTLTANAVLIGNGTSPIKSVTISNNYLVIGNTANGIRGVSTTSGGVLVANTGSGVNSITGTGVFRATISGSPSFGTALVNMGGTGVTTLTSGGLVKGNGTGAVTTLTGTGVVYATASGSPTFGVAPLAYGGTGGTSAATARSNLSVYSKDETNVAINNASSVTYNTTLYTSSWTASGSNYVQTYTNANLVAKNPPIITYTSNRDEYSYITSAEATAKANIVFTASTKPTADIGISITDIM